MIYEEVSTRLYTLSPPPQILNQKSTLLRPDYTGCRASLTSLYPPPSQITVAVHRLHHRRLFAEQRLRVFVDLIFAEESGTLG
ncbi:hypothetical protein L1987_74897 [Smallanthus sonchifolius]|uniref:Uncharacterized protein n=1 Tax=Smallanthus sonchifolius TaxID=185202 RepID=A0ACB9A4Y5_9ASTR|nr:hypothetical protein L1987_74897 [Smallanthus sonchifolius]